MDNFCESSANAESHGNGARRSDGKEISFATKAPRTEGKGDEEIFPQSFPKGKNAKRAGTAADA